MKKIVMVLVISLLCLSGCTTKQLTVKQSEENFLIYEDVIKDIALEFDCQITEVFDENMGSEECYKDFVILIDDRQEIFLRMCNSAFNSTKGVERFEISYSISDNRGDEISFNLELIVDVVNAISGKTITKQMCEEFLQAPESEYALEKHGLTKSENIQIQKLDFLNFWEEWNISYTLDDEFSETLSFWGLTKQIEK